MVKRNKSFALLANRHRQSKKDLYKLLDSSKHSVDLILRHLSDSYRPKLVCDIGAGYGALAVNFALKGIKTLAIEPFREDREQLEQIMEEYPKAKGFLRIIDAKAEKLPVKSASVDLCILSQVLEHVEDPENTIKEASRILKTGSFLYLAAPNYIFPMEQHYRLFYIPLMPKELLYLWVSFYFKVIKKQRFAKEELKDISNFIIGLNYTNNRMISKLFNKYQLKVTWFASSENISLLGQIIKHWETNPHISEIPLLLISLPLKITRVILTILGFLPKKLEYVAVKVK